MVGVIDRPAGSKKIVVEVFAFTLAAYVLANALISHYIETPILSFSLLLAVGAGIARHIFLVGIEKELLFLVFLFVFMNSMGLIFSPYSLKYEYAFYRLFPFAVALFVYRFGLVSAIRKLVVIMSLTNCMVALVEFKMSQDLFRIDENVYYSSYLDGAARVNGLFGYSLHLSSFLLFSCLFIITVFPRRSDVIVIFIIFLGSVFTFNKLNIILILCTLMYSVYDNFIRRAVGPPVQRLLVNYSLIMLSVLVVYNLIALVAGVVDPSTEANTLRLGYWAMGLSEAYENGFIELVIGVKLGVYQKYLNGFESQYIQFAAEYGIVGLIFLVGLFVRVLRFRAFFVCLIIATSFVTLRGLDNYASAFMAYLVIFCTRFHRQRKDYSQPDIYSAQRWAEE